MNYFTLYNYTESDINFTMAADSVLSEKHNALTFYNLTKTLCIGPKQDFADVDVEACIRDGVRVARRITVGHATLCGPFNFHFSIILKGQDMRPSTIATQWSEFIAAALKQLDLVIEVFRFVDTRDSHYPDCFKAMAADQGMWNGKKLVSVAQSRSRTSIVIHCVIPMTPEVYSADKYLITDNEEPLVGASLQDTGLTKEHLKNALIRAFSSTYGLYVDQWGITEYMPEIMQLRKDKFSSEEWIIHGWRSQRKV